MLKIVKKKSQDKDETIRRDAGTPWEEQWMIDDIRDVPRVIRGTTYLGVFKPKDR